ncbi:hypothetical protein [Kiloniella sp.]|uniref:hypothetical protein n=1 Tax=Kiloniella sp. TaxID=1938587 RepID=UPI003B01B953
MLIVIYLLYVKLSETIHINRLLGGRHLFLLNKAEKSQYKARFLNAVGRIVRNSLQIVRKSWSNGYCRCLGDDVFNGVYFVILCKEIRTVKARLSSVP